MKFEYEYTRKDLFNYLKQKSNFGNKYIYIFYFLLTILLCIDGFKENFVITSVIILLGFGLLYTMLKILMHFFAKIIRFIFEKTNPYLYGKYKCEIDENKISTVNGKHKVTIKKDEIKNIKINDDYIEIISTELATMIIIEKVIVKELYDDIKEAVTKLK